MVVVALLYLVLKYIAYAGWCLGGILLLGRAKRRNRGLAVSVIFALALGALRLLLGLLAGYAILNSPYFSDFRTGSYLQLLALLVPLRLLEWLLIYLCLGVALGRPAASSARDDEGLVPQRRTWHLALAWILGGVVLSILVDQFLSGPDIYFSR